MSETHLTGGNSSKFLEQLDVGLGLDGGGDEGFAAGGVQQGVVVEQAGLVAALHRGQNVLGHVGVEGLRVPLQGFKQAEEITPGLDFLGGEAGGQRIRQPGNDHYSNNPLGAA